MRSEWNTSLNSAQAWFYAGLKGNPAAEGDLFTPLPSYTRTHTYTQTTSAHMGVQKHTPQHPLPLFYSL